MELGQDRELQQHKAKLKAGRSVAVPGQSIAGGIKQQRDPLSTVLACLALLAQAPCSGGGRGRPDGMLLKVGQAAGNGEVQMVKSLLLMNLAVNEYLGCENGAKSGHLGSPRLRSTAQAATLHLSCPSLYGSPQP